jgi:AraC-like DNA-binding protein
MQNKLITNLKIPRINEFDFQIKYTETDRKSHTYEIGLHTHNEFELYINLSGDVSFLVENNLYDLSRGDVIIARPGEYHHCVYRSDAPHKLFWILFDCQKNKDILDFLKDGFRENYISPQGDLREELIDLCYALHHRSLTNEEKIYAFFRIFAILKQSKNNVSEKSLLSHEMHKIIDYIGIHIHEEITVNGIAKALYISQSTLERRFKEALDMTPLEYIRKKKLVLAAQMLQEGKSVLTAGTSVGYNDNSYFIELFKHYYKITPYQYKKKWHKT